MRAWIAHRATRNIGDHVSAPDLHLPALGLCRDEDDIDVELTTVQSDFFERTGATAVVVGGGGLLMPTHLSFLHALLWSRPSRPVVVWGVGSNYPMDFSGTEYPAWLSNATAVGLRDVGSPHEWVPCASCLLPGMRSWRTKGKRAVVYEHHERPLPDFGLPKLRNDAPGGIGEVLEFLGSSEIVVTNSYHGAYWSTLLGARVVLANPFSTKFGRLPWSVPVWTEHDSLCSKIDEAERRPDALERCIERNLSFWSSIRQHLDL